MLGTKPLYFRMGGSIPAVRSSLPDCLLAWLPGSATVCWGFVDSGWVAHQQHVVTVIHLQVRRV